MTPTYLIYLFSPISGTVKTRFFYFRAGAFKETGIENLRFDSADIVTFSTSTLIDCARPELSYLPKQIFDVDIALALLAQVPRQQKHHRQNLSFFEYLKDNCGPDDEPFLSYCFHGNHNIPEDTLLRSVQSIGGHLESLWLKILSDLDVKDETKRFFEIETPVAAVMLKRQQQGIRVDLEKVEQHLTQLDKNEAFAKDILRSKFSILDPKNRTQVRTAISNEPILRDIVFDSDSDGNTRTFLKLYSGISELASALHNFRESVRSKAILLGFASIGSGRVFPDFRVMGTVTGRIVVQNPLLQNIPTKFRDVLLPDQEMSLLYPDFKQCEPGILAFDANDANLIEDYNSGDIYEALSISLFRLKDKRNIAKLLFLFVCYGMKSQRVAKVGSDISGVPEKEIALAMEEFFSRYPNVEKWRAALKTRIMKQGKVGTLLGNYRVLSPMDLDNSLRSAQSQRIQGIASLILKQIIIQLNKALPKVEILIPMHDALLVQIPAKFDSKLREEIEFIFCSVYRKFCPSIIPKVSFDSFTKINS